MTIPESNHKQKEYSVDFDTPLVSNTHQISQPLALTWVPQSLAACSDGGLLKYIRRESDKEDDPAMSATPLS